MKTISSATYVLAWLICCSIPVSVYPQVTAETTALPAEAHEQLSKYADAMRVMQIHYTRALAGQVPSVYGGPTTFSDYFASNSFYQRTRYTYRSDDGKTSFSLKEYSFDGKIFYSGEPERPDPNNPSILKKYLVEDDTDPDRWMKLFYFPYLEAAGFFAPSAIAEIKERAGEPLLESLVLLYIKESDLTRVERKGHLLRISVRITDPVLKRSRYIDAERERKALLSGRNSHSLVTKEMKTLEAMQQNAAAKRSISFLLDPKRGYGVIQREDWTADGQRIGRIQCDDWKYYGDADIWLPSQCVASYYTHPDQVTEFSTQVQHMVTHQLQQAKFQSSEDVQYVLEYTKPGSTIIDRTTVEARKRKNHSVIHTIPADARSLRDAGSKALQATRTPRLAFWFIVINVAVVTIYVAFRFRVKK